MKKLEKSMAVAIFASGYDEDRHMDCKHYPIEKKNCTTYLTDLV